MMGRPQSSRGRHGQHRQYYLDGRLAGILKGQLEMAAEYHLQAWETGQQLAELTGDDLAGPLGLYDLAATHLDQDESGRLGGFLPPTR
jgi:hypothetical protein